MRHPISGLHHVTATVAGAQDDLDFATGALGLRLVKKTVNFDNRGVYHFYYGNESGTPGTVWTTFPYAGRGVPQGRKGSGQISVTSFSVPAGSLSFWEGRLVQRGVKVREGQARFGEESLIVSDPSGLDLELIASDHDPRSPWTGNAIPASAASRGLHSVTLQSRLPADTGRVLTELLGFHPVNETKGRIRLGHGDEAPGKLVDVVDASDAPLAHNGLGTVHHVAFAISDEAEQLRLRQELIDRGLVVTEVLDRSYFRSIYFREPGGILFEVATVSPGFAIDEDLAALGSGLRLPPWEEANRAAIEQSLPPVRVP
jgi:glyoxalase family protein